MILLVLLVGFGATWVITPRLDPSNQVYIVSLIFALTALAVVAQGVTVAYVAKQARLRRAALAHTEGWPKGSEDDEDPMADRMATRMEGRNLAGELGDRD